jgi:hypothetical protein
MSGARRIKARDTFRPRMIRAAAEILSHGEPSLFRYEAHCRHAIRSHLCLEGALWAEADQRAASIVTAALDRIGAVRPTWHEGQLEHAENFEIEHRNCAMCGARSGEDLVFTHGKYCSALCRHRAMGGERPCEQCGKVYQTYKSHHQYCSRRCWDAAQTIHIERPCEHCGVVFKPASRLGHGKSIRFCSISCANRARRKPIPEAQCIVCMSIFTPKRPGKTVCSQSCAGKRASSLRWVKRVEPEPPAEEEPMRRAAE